MSKSVFSRNAQQRCLINKVAALVLVLLLSAAQSQAQFSPFQSMFFQNRYLLNPALAGIDKGLVVNINYQQQLNSFPGAPRTGILTADYAASDQVGLGFNASNDQAGIIRTTTLFGSYAYHVTLDNFNEQHLHFGLSVGLDNSRIDFSKVKGDVTDNTLLEYNTLKPYIDGQVGIAYTNSDGLLVSAAAPNLSATLLGTSDSRYNNDQLLFVGAIAYKFSPDNKFNNYSIEPMLAFRKIKGYDDIFDAGLKTSIKAGKKGFIFQVIYHTDHSLNGGFGIDLEKVSFIFNYTLETGALGSYAGSGATEVGIRFHLFNSDDDAIKF